MKLQTALPVLIVALTAAQPALADQGGAGGLPKPSPAVFDVKDGVRYELDRFQDAGQTLLVFKLGETGHPAAGTPLAVQAQALDRLWRRQAQALALPRHLEVRFGDTRYALISALQARLLKPNAGWDSHAGRAARGSSGLVVQTALADVAGASPLAQAVARHGYRLRLTDVARIEVGRPPSAEGAILPTQIDEMDFTADAVR